MVIRKIAAGDFEINRDRFRVLLYDVYGKSFPNDTFTEDDADALLYKMRDFLLNGSAILLGDFDEENPVLSF